MENIVWSGYSVSLSAPLQMQSWQIYGRDQNLLLGQLDMPQNAYEAIVHRDCSMC